MTVLNCSRPSKAYKRLQTEPLGVEVEEEVLNRGDILQKRAVHVEVRGGSAGLQL